MTSTYILLQFHFRLWERLTSGLRLQQSGSSRKSVERNKKIKTKPDTYVCGQVEQTTFEHSCFGAPWFVLDILLLELCPFWRPILGWIVILKKKTSRFKTGPVLEPRFFGWWLSEKKCSPHFWDNYQKNGLQISPNKDCLVKPKNCPPWMWGHCILRVDMHKTNQLPWKNSLQIRLVYRNLVKPKFSAGDLSL